MIVVLTTLWLLWTPTQSQVTTRSGTDATVDENVPRSQGSSSSTNPVADPNLNPKNPPIAKQTNPRYRFNPAGIPSTERVDKSNSAPQKIPKKKPPKPRVPVNSQAPTNLFTLLSKYNFCSLPT